MVTPAPTFIVPSASIVEPDLNVATPDTAKSLNVENPVVLIPALPAPVQLDTSPKY